MVGLPDPSPVASIAGASHQWGRRHDRVPDSVAVVIHIFRAGARQREDALQDAVRGPCSSKARPIRPSFESGSSMFSGIKS